MNGEREGGRWGEASSPIQNQSPIDQKFNALVHGDRSNSRIERHSNTWQAVKGFIKEQVEVDHMPLLRKSGIDHGQTEYARGAMDALDSLLRFGGEDI